MQILPPWLALPKSLKRNYRYFTLDKALPAPGKLLFVQCEEGFRRVRPELTKDPRTGDTVMQFTSIDTGSFLRSSGRKPRADSAVGISGG